jgi:serine/threonine-protein kinase
MDATGANLPLKKMQFKIDTAKKEREVAEIVESDEFKLLEQQVSKFRNQSETLIESGLQPVLKTNISESDRREVALKPQLLSPNSAVVNPQFLEHCEQELGRCIGPLAHYMIEDILAESPHLTPQQLVEALAAEISESGRSHNFLDSIKIPATSNSETETSESLPDSHKTGDLRDHLNPQFLEHCRQELMRCMGPMGNFLLEDILAQFPHLAIQQLIEVLVAEIPDNQRAQEFKNRLNINLLTDV